MIINNTITLITNILNDNISFYNFIFNCLQNDLLNINNLFIYQPFNFNQNSNLIKSNITHYNNLYIFLIFNNYSFFTFSTKKKILSFIILYIYKLLIFLIKINVYLYILYTIYFIIYLDNYMKQLKSLISLTRGIILNATEKEVGPTDDFLSFSILFVLTITLFIFSSIILILLQGKIIIWAIGGFFILMFLILTLPLNLLIDFGINFCVVIRGSGTSGNIIKEVLLDIMGAFIIFIRFLTQNIRFIFIFSGIFELLEWVFSNNYNFFISSIYTNNNIFVNSFNLNSLLLNSNTNLLIINTLLFIILYLYYFLHLLFLLLVQVSIYIGVSIWLFFFLYSSKFLKRKTNWFIHKKLTL